MILSRPLLLLGGMVCLLAASLLPNHAAIGDTRDDLFRKYGAGKEIGGQMLYSVSEIYSLSIYFDKEHVTMDVYSRSTNSDGTREDLTDEDVKKLLEIEGEGLTWNRMASRSKDHTWCRSDGKVIARFNQKDQALVFIDAKMR